MSHGILDADAVLARIIPAGSLEQIIYRVDALHWIEERGVPVMNSPRAIERSVDKFYTTALLQEAGLPTPETVVCEGADEAMAAVLAMGDVIDQADLRLDGPRHGARQRSRRRVPRVAVAGADWGRVLRAARRRSRRARRARRSWSAAPCSARSSGSAPEGEWRTNVSRGGSARPIELPPAWEQLALRAAAAVGADYAGVDLLPSRDGTVFVLEVNGIPGWQGLQQATGLDVAGAIVEPSERDRVRRHARVRHALSVPADDRRRQIRSERRRSEQRSSRAPYRSTRAAQLACLLEASAPKPGNVSPGRHFGDARYEDFLASAVAIGGPLTGAGDAPLGATVRLAVEATARWTALEHESRHRAAAGAARAGGASACSRPGPSRQESDARRCRELRSRRVLDATTVEDARDVYAAIRRAAPGGLGRVDEQDVAGEPTMTLVDVMRLAADRDGIAREYATGFETTFEAGARRSSGRDATACPGTTRSSRRSCTLLAAAPDTHVARRGGAAVAAEVSRRRARRWRPAAFARRRADARSTRWIARCATRATPPTPAPRRT